MTLPMDLETGTFLVESEQWLLDLCVWYNTILAVLFLKAMCVSFSDQLNKAETTTKEVKQQILALRGKIPKFILGKKKTVELKLV